MGLVCIFKQKGLVWHEAQLKNTIKIVQLRNVIEKCDSQVQPERAIHKCDLKV